MKKSDFIVKVTKKGKTRGRPSKWELEVSSIMSNILKESEKAIHKAAVDSIIYGTGCVEITKEGKVKYKNIKKVQNKC